MPEDAELTVSIASDVLTLDLGDAELTLAVRGEQAVSVNGVELHALVYSKAT